MLSQASLKSQWPGYCRAKGLHPARDRSSMPSHFRVFWKEASLSCYYRAKGRYRKKNCSNFENSNQIERKLGPFFYMATLLSQFLTKQKCLQRTLLIFDYYWFYKYILLIFCSCCNPISNYMVFNDTFGLYTHTFEAEKKVSCIKVKKKDFGQRLM